MTTAMKIDATYANFRFRVSGNATVMELFLASGIRRETQFVPVLMTRPADRAQRARAASRGTTRPRKSRRGPERVVRQASQSPPRVQGSRGQSTTTSHKAH